MKWAFGSLLLLFLLPAPGRSQNNDDRVARDLAAVVRDSKASIWSRIEAANTLGQIGFSASAAVPELAAQLGRFRPNEHTTLQVAIVRALGQMGYAARSAMPALARSAGQNIDIDRAIRVTMTDIIHTNDENDLAALIEQLKSRDETMRLRGAAALGRLGPLARSAIPDLTVAMNDPFAEVRRAAATAWMAIQPAEKPIEAIFRVYALDLQDPDSSMRMRAAKILGQFGPAAAAALPALEAVLEDPDRDVRRSAIDAMNRISPP